MGLVHQQLGNVLASTGEFPYDSNAAFSSWPHLSLCSRPNPLQYFLVPDIEVENGGEDDEDLEDEEDVVVLEEEDEDLDEDEGEDDDEQEQQQQPTDENTKSQ